MSVKITKDHTDDLLRAIAALTGKEVLIGIPQENDPREGEPIGNAALGYIHETGAPEANIPARPFLIPGVESVEEQLIERMKKTGQAVMDGKFKEAERGLEAVGLMAVSAVQQKLVDGPFVPLAPRTLAAREAKGRTGTKPLLDTGAMRQAITYVVRPKDGRRNR